MKKLLGLVLAVALVLGFAATTHAADTYIGICFEIGWGSGLADNTWFWGEVDFSASAKIGEHGSVFVYFYNEIYEDSWWFGDHYTEDMFDGDLSDNLSFGYTYKINDQFSVSALAGGKEALSGQLAGDDDWFKLFHGDNVINWGDYYTDWTPEKVIEGRLKLVATPMEGLSITAAIEPSDMDFLIKGEFSGEIFKVGAGYISGFVPFGPADAEIRVYTTVYNVYGEVMPVDGLKIYGEYISDGSYLLRGTYAMDPFTFAVMYSNCDNGDDFDYAADTLDFAVDYALSDTMTLSGGLAYDVAGSAGLVDVWGKVTFGNAYFMVTDYLNAPAIVLEAGYKLDGSGSSLVYGWYDITNSEYYFGIYSEIW